MKSRRCKIAKMSYDSRALNPLLKVRPRKPKLSRLSLRKHATAKMTKLSLRPSQSQPACELPGDFSPQKM